MSTEIKTSTRFEKVGFDGERPKAMAASIDGLPVKSPAAFRGHFDRRFSAIKRRFSALENSVRSTQNLQLFGLLSIAAAVPFGFASPIFAILRRA